MLSSPSTPKSGINSSVSSPSKPTIMNIVAENKAILSVLPDYLDSKKQSIMTKELISRLESSKILIEYNFYLKAVKQNQVRIGMGTQFLERFRSSVHITYNARTVVEKQKVVDHSAASSYGNGDVVAAKYRGQCDSVGSGRKVTFGNPQVERASSPSRITIPERVREIHSPGNPCGGSQCETASESASAASRRQVGSTPTPQQAAVGGACNKSNNYQQNAVAAVCLAGPQFEGDAGSNRKGEGAPINCRGSRKQRRNSPPALTTTPVSRMYMAISDKAAMEKKYSEAATMLDSLKQEYDVEISKVGSLQATLEEIIANATKTKKYIVDLEEKLRQANGYLVKASAIVSSVAQDMYAYLVSANNNHKENQQALDRAKEIVEIVDPSKSRLVAVSEESNLSKELAQRQSEYRAIVEKKLHCTGNTTVALQETRWKQALLEISRRKVIAENL
eukprot:gene36384-47365_t